MRHWVQPLWRCVQKTRHCYLFFYSSLFSWYVTSWHATLQQRASTQRGAQILPKNLLRRLRGHINRAGLHAGRRYERATRRKTAQGASAAAGGECCPQPQLATTQRHEEFYQKTCLVLIVWCSCASPSQCSPFPAVSVQSCELFLLTIILELFPLHPQFFLLVACESCGGSLLRFARACPPLGSMPGSRVDSSGGWFFFSLSTD